jgi:uncharacterized membrane protein YidH (DUF202 family)
VTGPATGPAQPGDEPAEPATETATGPAQPGDEPEERVPGLARERTALAWTRTAISFAALGGVVLRANVVTGLIILVVAPVIWQLGRVSRGRSDETTLPVVGATRLFLITSAIVVVSLLCLVIAVFGHAAPGALR